MLIEDFKPLSLEIELCVVWSRRTAHGQRLPRGSGTYVDFTAKNARPTISRTLRMIIC